MGGGSRFQNVVRIRYDGFLLGNGVGTPDGDKTPGYTILEVLEVVDNLGQDETGDFVGKLGSMGWMDDTGVVWVGG